MCSTCENQNSSNLCTLAGASLGKIPGGGTGGGRLQQRCTESQPLRQQSWWVDVGRETCVLGTPAARCKAGSGGGAPCCREEAMSKGSLPASWPGHKPAAELPKTRAGHLNQTKSSRGSPGTHGLCTPKQCSSLACAAEDMQPWPPAAACTK